MILFKNEPIKWNEITHIEQWPQENAAWLYKFLPVRLTWRLLLGYTVSVRAKSFKTKEILVMSGLRNYKELLQTVVDNCKDNPGIVIDPKVLEVINRNS